MTTITIPKLNTEEEFIAIPRREYEAMFGPKKTKEFKPTPAQKKALAKAELNFRKGKTLSYNDFRSKLEFTN